MLYINPSLPIRQSGDKSAESAAETAGIALACVWEQLSKLSKLEALGALGALWDQLEIATCNKNMQVSQTV